MEGIILLLVTLIAPVLMGIATYNGLKQDREDHSKRMEYISHLGDLLRKEVGDDREEQETGGRNE